MIALWLLFLLAPGADADVRQRLEAAQQAERKQDYASAGAQYQAILAEHPEMAAIRQSLGLTYHLRNQFTEAIAEFNRAVAADPTMWGSFLFLGMDYYKTNQFEKALGALRKSVALNGKMAEPEARFWLGASEAALGRQGEALREFRRAAELRPKDIEVLYQLAKTNEENASATFQKIGQLNPRAAVVSLLQAERFASENRAEQARAEYRVAVTLRPDFAGSVPSLEPVGERLSTVSITGADAKANFDLAQVYTARGDAARARQAREALTGLQPADEVARQYAKRSLPAPAAVAAWTRLFQANTQSEAYECATAEAALKELLVRDAQNLDVLLALGKNYQRWAELVLRQMIAINPDSYRVHQLSGEQQEQKTEYQKALASYQTALAKQPDLSGIRFAIGQVYWKMQQYDEAERWLLEELKRNPHHGLAHYRLGSIYTERGKADEAIEHLTEALQSHPGMSAAQFDLGRALILKARYSDAVTVLLRVAAGDPENDRVHYVLANAYRKMGKAAEAQAEFAKYQELSRKRLTRVQKDIKDVTESLEGKP
ncbi:MAG: tetratricopeptide repeat protein [Bryobacteraceae bacterium]